MKKKAKRKAEKGNRDIRGSKGEGRGQSMEDRENGELRREGGRRGTRRNKRR